MLWPFWYYEVQYRLCLWAPTVFILLIFSRRSDTLTIMTPCCEIREGVLAKNGHLNISLYKLFGLDILLFIFSQTLRKITSIVRNWSQIYQVIFTNNIFNVIVQVYIEIAENITFFISRVKLRKILSVLMKLVCFVDR